ncbi:MAG: NUDIX domain-containing protein [Chloroflexi bacterium]|jgi:8-oxo-dGTP diphosphatase|nr:NUDIX domain-containing protein [Chloroflexota bacterium]MBT4003938.1 NUDIX domain-containing protein [Chloroflexota bacterium]MBT4305756.1 NUDIX domain-containing protein [Chloroflexota bacterium]MBT4533580.1 NUDIX domain-containing protein [Chloroflexota bacterium]MBT4681777.1 NUDIX domain-containing protein [Chloroflexota bacterium]
MTENVLLAGVILEDSNGHIALQLRDEDPKIINPGLWSIFGGHIEIGELPGNAAQREMLEELSIHISLEKLDLLGKFEHHQKLFYVFHYQVTDEMNDVTLKEGQDWRWCTTDEINSGEINGKNIVDYHIEFIQRFRGGNI